jgi:hypothetical protein
MQRESLVRSLILTASVALAWCVVAAAHAADEPQTPIDWQKAQQLFDRSKAGESLTPEERAYLDRARQARARGEGKQAPGKSGGSAQGGAAQGQIDFQRTQQLMQKSRRGEQLTAEEQTYLERAKKARAAQSQTNPGGANTAAYNDPRSQELLAKRKEGKKLSEEERLYLESRRDAAESRIERQNQEGSAQRNADYGKAHPPRDSIGLLPLTELGKESYQGEQGGLYPGGANTMPAEHLQAGLRLAAQIVPLDAQGRPSPDGDIVLCSIGMSNTTQESRSFLKLIGTAQGVNPKLKPVDCAQGAQTAAKIADPKWPYWNVVQQRLTDAQVTPAQVQVVWFKEANSTPKEPFPAEAKKLQLDMLKDLYILHDTFPNLKIVYLSSRIYGGYAAGPLNPEPHAYESNFAVKWLIADQLAGQPELNFDPAKGPVRAPWLAWGPYLWADGLKARADGLVWKREDLGPDGTHPSMLGREKVARMLLDFLKTDPTAKPWFAK